MSVFAILGTSLMASLFSMHLLRFSLRSLRCLKSNSVSWYTLGVESLCHLFPQLILKLKKSLKTLKESLKFYISERN